MDGEHLGILLSGGTKKFLQHNTSTLIAKTIRIPSFS
jgi:hypothetical protein